MISKSQFASLRGGDLILWNKKYLRTILSGPFDKARTAKNCDGHLTVDLPIRHRSWTGRTITVYSYTDLKDKIRKVSKRVRGLILKSEVEVLKAARFNPRTELKRELQEHKARMQRMGRELCPGFKRIERLAETSVDKPPVHQVT